MRRAGYNDHGSSPKMAAHHDNDQWRPSDATVARCRYSATMTAARWGAGRQDGPLTMATANPRTRLIPRTEYDGSSSMY